MLKKPKPLQYFILGSLIFYSLGLTVFHKLQLTNYSKESTQKIYTLINKDIDQGNVFKITEKLSLQLGEMNWTCIKGRKGGESFINLIKSSCEESFTVSKITIFKPERPDIKVDLYIKLPTQHSNLIITLFGLLFMLTSVAGVIIINFYHKVIRTEEAKVKEIKELSYKVAHDIRSPLDVISFCNENEMYEQELLKPAIDRIENICSSLLLERKSEELNSHQLLPLLESVIQEKKIRSNCNFKLEIPANFSAKVLPSEFQAIASNLINNSIEAGATNVSIYPEGKSMIIEDSGSGIPSYILSKLFQDGITSGKSKGNGIGLYQAKKYLKSWNGDIGLLDSSNNGTKFKITLDH